MDREIQPLGTLLKIYNFYIDEAKKCNDVKAYFAGCVLLGAALEAILLIMVALYSDEINTLKKFPTIRGKTTAPINWSFSALLNVARELEWLPGKLKRTDAWEKPQNGDVGDAARLIQEIRNLIHPGKYLRDYPSVDITEQHFNQVFDFYNDINTKLSDKLKEKGVFFGFDQ